MARTYDLKFRNFRERQCQDIWTAVEQACEEQGWSTQELAPTDGFRVMRIFGVAGNDPYSTVSEIVGNVEDANLWVHIDLVDDVVR